MFKRWPDRFWRKVDTAGGWLSCWEWAGTHNTNGYAKTSVSGKMHLAHRAAYELVVAPIPKGLQLDHLCRNRGCVNPSHLEPVTNIENCRRGLVGSWQKSKTNCPCGHKYDGSNTILTRGRRRCRICYNASRRRRRLRNLTKCRPNSHSNVQHHS